MNAATSITKRKPGFCTRLGCELRRLALLVIVIGLVAITAKYYGFDRLNDEIRARVEEQLQKHYQGLTITVKSARRIAGKGVEIRGIRVREGGGKDAPIL